MSTEPETFEYGPGGRRTAFVVVERRTPEDYRREGELRTAAHLEAYRIVATVRARRLRGKRLYLFYEVAREGGGVWRAAAERF